MLNFFTGLKKTINEKSYESASNEIPEDMQPLCPNSSKKIDKWIDGISLADKNKILKQLYNQIRFAQTKSAIIPIIKPYGNDILIDFVYRYINDDIIKKNLDIILPVTDKDIIIDLVENSISINVIESVAYKININAEDANKRTCLFYTNNISYLCNLLSSNKLKFNVNHQDEIHNTFIMHILGSIKIDDVKMWNKFIDILISKEYNFNHNYQNEKLSFVDVMCLTGNDKDKMYKIISMQNYDISSQILFIHKMLNNYDTNTQLMIIIHMLERQDYHIILNKILCKYAYQYGSADIDITLFLNLIGKISSEKLIEMIEYKNENGNNVMHLASIHHLDKVIYFITSDPCINQHIEKLCEKNNDGHNPYMLYTDNNIANRLAKYNYINLF